MKLELALHLAPFILTLAFEVNSKGVHLTWHGYNAEAAVERSPRLVPEPDVLRRAGVA